MTPDPGTSPASQASVQEALDRGDHPAVLHLTDQILASRPGDDAAHELRARSLLALGRAARAAAAGPPPAAPPAPPPRRSPRRPPRALRPASSAASKFLRYLYF